MSHSALSKCFCVALIQQRNETRLWKVATVFFVGATAPLYSCRMMRFAHKNHIKFSADKTHQKLSPLSRESCLSHGKQRLLFLDCSQHFAERGFQVCCFVSRFSHGGKEVFSCVGIKLAVDWFRLRGHKQITVFVPQWRKETPRIETPIRGTNRCLALKT